MIGWAVAAALYFAGWPMAWVCLHAGFQLALIEPDPDPKVQRIATGAIVGLWPIVGVWYSLSQLRRSLWTGQGS